MPFPRGESLGGLVVPEYFYSLSPWGLVTQFRASARGEIVGALVRTLDRVRQIKLVRLTLGHFARIEGKWVHYQLYGVLF